MKRLLLPTVAFTVLWGAALAATGSHAAADGATPPTFSNQVVRIFQQNCQSCHHPGDIGPFSMMRFEDAAPYAPLIKEKTQSRDMPPWKPDAGCAEFRDARRLSQEDIDTIAAWVDAGAPEGDRAEMPSDVTFPDEWKSGEPDAVIVTSPKPFKFAADTQNDVYRCFTLPTTFDADRFVTNVEIRPGNRTVVHHVLVFVDTTGESIALDKADPGPGYRSSGGGVGFTPSASLGGWAPGASAFEMPENSGVLVPKGARIVVQVHYSTHGLHGEDEYDQTKVGLRFARTPIYQDFYVLPLINTTFTIPAGAAHHEVNAAFTLPPGVNITLHGVGPHMHLLGREMHVEAALPSGETRCLISISNWEFHWQGMYRYVEPIALPGGTRLSLSAFYDNSTANPENPNTTPRDVSWGEGTTDEMCIAFLGVTIDAEHRSVSSPGLTAVRAEGSKLVVTGSDLRKGALIEIDGVVVRDSKVKGRKGVTSAADWQLAVPAGATASITVLNPDGARSAPLSFTR